MTKRMDCIKKSSVNKEGVLLDGHSYVAVLAVEDLDTSRVYLFDVCEDCGHALALFTDSESRFADSKDHYPEYQAVGGSDD